MKIGEIMASDREITLNEGKKAVTIMVANKGDRPVQVGSHFHFFEVNRCLSFDREKAYGYHLVPINKEADMNFFRDKLSLESTEMQAIAEAIAREME